MTNSPRLELPYIISSQAQKEVTHNDALNDLDSLTQISVINMSTNTPPASPDEGDSYIIGASPTGAWSGHAGDLATYYSGWRIKMPMEGWLAWVQDLAAYYFFDGAGWVELDTGGGGSGTVTSVDVSGGTTGLTTSGGPVTTSGAITLAGTLAVANGGSGATSASGARSNLGAAASGANTDITSVLLNQTGLVVKGDSSNALTIKPNEILSVGRTLNIVTGDADRTITLGGNATINGGTYSGTNSGDQTITLSGAVSGSGTGSISTTFASVADKSILANISGGAAAPSANTLTGIIDSAIGSTQGQVLYRGASSWSVLNPGTSGQFLKTQGASANPVWADASGGGSVTSVDVSGGATGLTTSGGPVTSSGTITLAGTLAVANGGSGATSASGARSNLGAAASGANTDITSVLLNQTGLVVKGGSSNALTIKPNETLSAGRTLNLVTGDADRTITLGGNPTINGGTHSGMNTGDQTITLTGNVTGSGTGSFATTIASSAVTNAMLAGSIAGSKLTHGGPIQPSSVYISDTAGRLFPNFHAGAGGNASPKDFGWGVMASLSADATLQLRFPMPPSIPGGILKLRMLALANATSGNAKVTVSSALVAAEESPSGATLAAESQNTVSWSTGDNDQYKETLVSLTPTGAPAQANDMLAVAVTFNTTSWTLAQVSTWQFTVIWE